MVAIAEIQATELVKQDEIWTQRTEAISIMLSEGLSKFEESLMCFQLMGYIKGGEYAANVHPSRQQTGASKQSKKARATDVKQLQTP